MRLTQLFSTYHQKTLKPYLNYWQRFKQLPAALLFSGPPGIGKNHIAKALAQWLLCQTEPQSQTLRSFPACQRCLMCKKVLSGQCIDYLTLTSEEPSIKIESCRWLQEQAGYGALEGRYKIILIPHVERMSSSAAHAFLKLLEEPPPQWIFLMTTQDPSLLLMTLRSRCQIIRLSHLSQDWIKERLIEEGQKPLEAKLYAHLAQGNYRKAQLFTQESILQQRASWLKTLTNPNVYQTSWMDWAAQESLFLEILIDQWEQLVAELIEWSILQPNTPAQRYPWKQPDAQQAFQAQINRALGQLKNLHQARIFWIEYAEELAQTRALLHTPVNRKIIIQSIFYKWLF